MPKCTVLPNKYITGWAPNVSEDKNGNPIRMDLKIVDLEKALEAHYTDDAHFAPYYLADKDGNALEAGPRMNQGPWVDVETGYIEKLDAFLRYDFVILDVDGPDHKATQQWIDSQILGLQDSPWADNLGWYSTRGGYRLMWHLPETVGPKKYIQILLSLNNALRQYGVYADELSDYNRTYRLPFVRRNRQDERRPHDWSWMADGPLDPLPEGADSDSIFDGIGSVKKPLQLEQSQKITKEMGRNNTLTRIAGSFRHKGLEQSEILVMLQTLNQTRCEPPLPQTELEVIAKSVCRYDPAPQQADNDGGDDDGGGDGGGGGLNAEGARFTLGSEVEITEHVCGDLETSMHDEKPVKMVYDRSVLWRYNSERGLWNEVMQERVQRIVAGYDGEMIRTGTDRNETQSIAR